MADTAIAITAGTGTNVDTRTEATNGNHRQVIIIGDPSVNAGVAPVDATTGLRVNVGTDVVNLVTGQTSITAGAGAVAANTPRVTHASDDPVTTALQIMDDWDETDRAKVNIIAGQAGVAAGAGAVGATVPRVTLASDDPGVAKLGTINTAVVASAKAVEGDYETVAASQTAQTLGATGATGDFISHILVIPATTSPGNILLLDNATSITVFVGGATSVSNLVPFAIPLNMISVSGAWKITTGLNVSCIGIGSFT